MPSTASPLIRAMDVTLQLVSAQKDANAIMPVSFKLRAIARERQRERERAAAVMHFHDSALKHG